MNLIFLERLLGGVFFKRCSMQCNRLTRKPFFGLRYSEDRTSFQVSDVQVFTNNMQLTGMGA